MYDITYIMGYILFIHAVETSTAMVLEIRQTVAVTGKHGGSHGDGQGTDMGAAMQHRTNDSERLTPRRKVVKL